MRQYVAVVAALVAAIASVALASAATPAPACPDPVGTATLVKHEVMTMRASDVRVLCFYKTADGTIDQNADLSVDLEPKGQSASEPYMGCGWKDSTQGVFEDRDFHVAGQVYYQHATQDYFFTHSGPWKDAVLAFMKQAEAYATPCTAAAPGTGTGARHTWSFSSRGIFAGPRDSKGNIAWRLTGAAGAGTLDVGANGEPTAARGSLGLTLTTYSRHQGFLLHYKLGVVGGLSFQRSTGSVDHLVVSVKVLNLRTSSVDCIADPEGTVELTDGNGEVPDTLVVRSVCELGFTDQKVRINIR